MIPPKPDSFAVFLRKLASGNILKRKPLHDFPLIQLQGHLPGQTRWLNLIFYELQILGQLKTLFFCNLAQIAIVGRIVRIYCMHRITQMTCETYGGISDFSMNVIAMRAPVRANDLWCDAYLHHIKAFLKPTCGDVFKVIFTFNIPKSFNR